MTDEEARKGYRFSGEPNVKFDPTSLSGGKEMTDTNNGWPGKPGVPLNPEKDGAHRLRHQDSGLMADALWSCGGTWLDLSGDFSIPHAAAFYDYLGPCLTPDQATALQARVAELDQTLWQLLDDMRDSLCVCQQAKDEARAALERKKE